MKNFVQGVTMRLVVAGAILMAGALAMGAAADHYQWQLPVGFYQSGVKLAGIDTSGNFVTSGQVKADGGFVVQNGLAVKGGLTADSLNVTGASSFDGGVTMSGTNALIGANTLGSVQVTGLEGVDGGILDQGKAVPAVMAGATGGIPGVYVGHTNVGTPATFSPTFASTPECACTDITSAAAVKCVTSGGPPVTTITMTGTGTDTISFVCVGPR